MSIKNKIITSEECANIKQEKWFKDSNIIWNRNRLNSSNNIGQIMKLMEDYSVYAKINNEEITHNGFFNWYTENIYSFDHILNIAKKFQECLENSNIIVSLADVFVGVYSRIFYQTWVGFMREERALLKIQEIHKDGIVKKGNDKLDRTYGIDIIVVDKNDKITHGYQIKPYSYKLNYDKYLQGQYVPKWFMEAYKQNYNRFELAKKDLTITPNYWFEN